MLELLKHQLEEQLANAKKQIDPVSEQSVMNTNNYLFIYLTTYKTIFVVCSLCVEHDHIKTDQSNEGNRLEDNEICLLLNFPLFKKEKRQTSRISLSYLNYFSHFYACMHGKL